jgi:predicted secreted hydrolase
VKGIAQSVLMLLLVVSATPSAADAEFPNVVPGYSIELPRDEGSHPQFRTEWWYLTGWVESESGEPFGFQVTFFRNRPGVDEDNPSRFLSLLLMFV